MALFTEKERIEKMNSMGASESGVKFISPSLWLAIAGAVILIAVVICWCIFGQISHVQEINGIYVGDGKCICFKDMGKEKIIDEGMAVNVCPDTISSKNYGSMPGKVTESGDDPLSEAEAEELLGSESLAEYFLKDGPVSYVICTLEKDDSSVNGYKWTSKQGKNVKLKKDTYVTVEVTTEWNHPVMELFPDIE